MLLYSKVSRRMWGDAKFASLSKPQSNAQTLWLYLLCGPHCGVVPGLFSVGELGLAEALEWSLESFRESFAELLDNDMVRVDWKARLVWLPNAIRHNEPQNPNVVKSWVQVLQDLPECELKNEAVSALISYLETRGAAFAKPVRDGFANHSPNDSPNHSGNGLANRNKNKRLRLSSKTTPTPSLRSGTVGGSDETQTEPKAPASTALSVPAENGSRNDIGNGLANDSPNHSGNHSPNGLPNDSADHSANGSSNGSPNHSGMVSTGAPKASLQLAMREPSLPRKSDAQRVFGHWVSVMGKGRNAVLDDKRRKAIQIAVDTYGVDRCLAAIDGCARSPFHMGQNDQGKRYNDITLILRDAKHVEEFEELASSQPTGRGSASNDPDPPEDDGVLAAVKAQLRAANHPLVSRGGAP